MFLLCSFPANFQVLAGPYIKKDLAGTREVALGKFGSSISPCTRQLSRLSHSNKTGVMRENSRSAYLPDLSGVKYGIHFITLASINTHACVWYCHYIIQCQTRERAK